MDVADKFGFKVSFMAEVLQQLMFRKYAAKNRNLKIQADTWDETVRIIKERGHDIQLHLHPQWYQANYQDGHFKLGHQWNIADFSDFDQKEMIKQSIAYLQDILNPIDNSFSPIGFKAGSWALQPSQKIMTHLAEAGIRIVLGVGLGIKYVSEHFYLDYQELEEDMLPYYPDFQDVRRLAETEQPIYILPMPYFTERITTMVKALKNFMGFRLHNNIFYFDKLANQGKHYAVSPMQPPHGMYNKISSLFKIKNYDLSGDALNSWKVGIDQIVGRALKKDRPTVPIILQSHTKGYSNFDAIYQFFAYITDKYGDLSEFMTLSEIFPTLNTMVREKTIPSC